jgi:hypothetical protein
MMQASKRVKNLALYFALCCGCLFFASCSIGYDFVIVNESEAPIELTLEIREAYWNYFFQNVLAKQQMSKSYDPEQWKGLAPAEFSADEGKRLVVLTIKPREAVRVESVTNYDKDSLTGAQHFKLKGLRITGQAGEVNHTGDQARAQFRASQSGHYEIVYRGFSEKLVYGTP